jgi:hypothetical protein
MKRKHPGIRRGDFISQHSGAPMASEKQVESQGDPQIELQVAKGRSIHKSTGRNILKEKDGSHRTSPKRFIVFPEKLQCSPEVAEFLLRTGVCIDPTKPVPEFKILPGTTSTQVLSA